MKRLGIVLIAFAIFLALPHLLFPKLSFDGVWWEILFILIGVFASLWIPDFSALKRMKLHWRLALFFAVFSAIFVVFGVVLKILPVFAQDYAFLITILLFGLIAILFDFLDKRIKEKDLP